jgi:hypothetical protein
MNETIEIAEQSLTLPPFSELAAKDFAFASGQTVADWLDVNAQQWADFSHYWNALTLDRHMADGGTYRLRRYGAFALQRPGQMHLLPHEPYVQPLYINSLNGGVSRVFDPLETGFSQHVVLMSLLNQIADLVDTIEGQAQCWNIKLHPYRILAQPGGAGLPTPEGLHRDGVDYIATMLVKRVNIAGGETLVTDADKHLLWRKILSAPMDIVIVNDHRTMHAVTPVTPIVDGVEAYRDVLVVAFTKD